MLHDRIKFHTLYIAFSSVILEKTKAMKGSGQPKNPGGKKSLKRKATKGRGHGKPPQAQAKAGPTPAQVHASAAATGITVPLGQGVPHTRARAAQKLPSFYEL